jgi:hypothetical protein
VGAHRLGSTSALKAVKLRSPALIRADFDDSALTFGYLRWVCWPYVRHYVTQASQV